MARDKKSKDSKNNLQNGVSGETFSQNQKYPIAKYFLYRSELHTIWIPSGNYQNVPLSFTLIFSISFSKQQCTAVESCGIFVSYPVMKLKTKYIF